MTLKEFIPIFADLFEDTDPSEMLDSTIFTDLDDWDSLTALSVIALVKTSFEKSITAKEIRSCETVEDLYNFIQTL